MRRLRWFTRFALILAAALAVVTLAFAQPSEDLAVPEGSAPVVDGLVSLDAQEWVVSNCANLWAATGSVSLCAVHDCDRLYLIVNTSYYHPERAPLFVVFDRDRDGVSFTPGDLALSSEAGFVTIADGAPQPSADTRAVYALDVQPETGELQLEAAIPLGELGAAPGAGVPYAFGQAPIPAAGVAFSTLTLDACGGPTVEAATPAPWPTEVTFERFLELQRAERAAHEAAQRDRVAALSAPLLLAVTLVLVVAVLLVRRRYKG